MLHAFSRFEMLVGRDAIEKLKRSKVAVFGVGGVGSYVVEGLARSGVGGFILVDNDVVCVTNLNRQLHATVKTLGRPKVDVMKERILEINPEAAVSTHQLFYLPETDECLFDRGINYIVDAVDTVTAKIGLILKAREMGIPIISSMGTGNKFDPEKLKITDISKTYEDPLARIMRKELRDRGITSLKVLFSSEVPSKAHRNEQQCSGVNCAATIGTDGEPTGRRSIPGSTSFVPPVAGLIIAAEVVRDLIGIT